MPTMMAYSGGVSSARAEPERSVGIATRWAFYAWMFSLPYDGIVYTWLPYEFQSLLSIPRIAGAVLMLAFLFDPRMWPWRLPPASAAFAVFLGVFTISMLRDSFVGSVLIFQQLQSIMLLLISYNVFLDRRVTRGALMSYAISCGFSALMAFLGIGIDPYEMARLGGRLTIVGQNPNAYALSMMVGTLVALGIVHVRKTRERSGRLVVFVLWGVALVTLAAVARSGSRSMSVALAVGLATFIFRKGSFGVQLRNLALVAIIGIVAWWIASHSELLVERWSRTAESGETSNREELMVLSIGMVKDRPLLGWGPGAIYQLTTRSGVSDKGEFASTHNVWLTMLTYTGLLGTLPYFFGYLVVLWMAWQARSGVESVLPLAIFMALLVASISAAGLPAKLDWTFYGYQLAAGQLAASALRIPARTENAR